MSVSSWVMFKEIEGERESNITGEKGWGGRTDLSLKRRPGDIG